MLEIALAAFMPIHEGFRETLGPALFAAFYPDWEGDYARTIAGWPPPPDGPERVHVAEEAGAVVAFLATRLDAGARTGEIGLNAVDPACQGRGIGGHLHAFALDELRGRGAVAATVATGGDAAHAPARAAYRAAGFTRAIPTLHLFREL